MKPMGEKYKQKSRKIPEKFPNNPGIENKGKSRPEKSRDPGIRQNPVPKIPGLKIWIPLGPAGDSCTEHVFRVLGLPIFSWTSEERGSAL